LRNVIERAVLLAGPESRTLTSLPDDHERSLTPEPPAQTQSNTPDSHGDVRGHGHGEHDSDGGLDELSNLPLKDAVERVEQRLIRLRLRDAGGNQAEAARRLGVPRRTLSYKIQRYGIDTDPGV
jgi:DNA-binding NtrC family response regulator